MAGDGSGGSYGGDWSSSDTAEVRTDSTALGMPYHETREINLSTGESRLKDSGHF